jgi:hypothetical protein
VVGEAETGAAVAAAMRAVSIHLFAVLMFTPKPWRMIYLQTQQKVTPSSLVLKPFWRIRNNTRALSSPDHSKVHTHEKKRYRFKKAALYEREVMRKQKCLIRWQKLPYSYNRWLGNRCLKATYSQIF